MKKIFFISAGATSGFACTSFLLTIICMMTGIIKQAPFGGFYWDIGRKSIYDSTEFDKKEKLLRGVKYENIKYAVDKDKIKIILDLVNLNGEAVDDFASISYVFTNDEKLVGIKDGAFTVKLEPNERLSITDQIENEIKGEFNKISIIFKQ